MSKLLAVYAQEGDDSNVCAAELVPEDGCLWVVLEDGEWEEFDPEELSFLGYDSKKEFCEEDWEKAAGYVVETLKSCEEEEGSEEACGCCCDEGCDDE